MELCGLLMIMTSIITESETAKSADMAFDPTRAHYQNYQEAKLSTFAL